MAKKPAKTSSSRANGKPAKPVKTAAKKPAAKKAPAKPAAAAKKAATLSKASKPAAKKAVAKKPAPKPAAKASKPIAKKAVAKKPAPKPAAKPVAKPKGSVKTARPAAPAKVSKPAKTQAAPAKPASKAAPAPKPVPAPKPAPAAAKPAAKPEPKPVKKDMKKEKEVAVKASSSQPLVTQVAAPMRPVAPPVVKKQTSTLESPDKVRYSDEELAEFKELILKKLEEARKDYDLLKQTLANTDNNGTDDTSPSFKMIEDGSETLSREETAQLAARQEKFIKHLEDALLRIRNKTYGICRVTGRLISKERLRLVPHATLSIEAKQQMGS